MPTLLTAATPFYFWGYMKFIGLVVFCLFFSGGGATDRTGHKEVMGGYFEKKINHAAHLDLAILFEVHVFMFRCLIEY